MSSTNKPEHGYLTNDSGQPSSMRLMSMVALLAAIALGFLTLKGHAAEAQTGLYLTSLFLIAAFAPKALQKFAEAKFPPPPTPPTPPTPSTPPTPPAKPAKPAGPSDVTT